LLALGETARLPSGGAASSGRAVLALITNGALLASRSASPTASRVKNCPAPKRSAVLPLPKTSHARPTLGAMLWLFCSTRAEFGPGVPSEGGSSTPEPARNFLWSAHGVVPGTIRMPLQASPGLAAASDALHFDG